MLKVGQTLWYVNNRGYGHSVTVTKVGRKWADLSNGRGTRIDVETLEVDGKGYTSLGKCWLSKDDYDYAVILNKLWANLVRYVRDNGHRKPDHITEDAIREASRLLGIEENQQ